MLFLYFTLFSRLLVVSEIIEQRQKSDNQASYFITKKKQFLQLFRALNEKKNLEKFRWIR